MGEAHRPPFLFEATAVGNVAVLHLSSTLLWLLVALTCQLSSASLLKYPGRLSGLLEFHLCPNVGLPLLPQHQQL